MITADRARLVTAVMVAVPGLMLGGLGLVHPRALSSATATQWWQLHLVLLPVFPLLAVALWVLLRGEHGPLAWLARIAAYGYAAFYTGLDALAGIAAGVVTERLQGASQVALDLRALGNDLGIVGAWALLAAAVLTAIVLVRRDGRRTLPGAALLVAGTVPLGSEHIYWPTGGLGLVAFALGGALLALVRARKG